MIKNNIKTERSGFFQSFKTLFKRCISNAVSWKRAERMRRLQSIIYTQKLLITSLCCCNTNGRVMVSTCCTVLLTLQEDCRNLISPTEVFAEIHPTFRVKFNVKMSSCNFSLSLSLSLSCTIIHLVLLECKSLPSEPVN